MHPSALDQSLHCPGCGFDLRATQSDRCGECGLVIDRAALLQTAIPWAYRRRLGYVRAYLKTFWQITFDRQSLRQEAVKPQELADARAFRRVTAGIISAGLLSLLAMLLWSEGLGGLALAPPSAPLPLRPEIAGLIQDMAVPWVAGATLLPVLPICLILIALSITGAARFVLRTPDNSGDASKRACALALYATAPLALILPAIFFLILLPFTAEKLFKELETFTAAFVLATIIGGCLFLFAIFATLIRTAQWAARTRHCSATRAFFAALELVGLWLLGWIVLLGLIPWAIGFCLIAVDSLR